LPLCQTQRATSKSSASLSDLITSGQKPASGALGEVAAMPGATEADGATGMEPGSRSGVAPAPEDHAFSDTLRQAARERDVPLATITDPGTVAPVDRELSHALVLIERAGGQNIRQARLAVRQLLAERDRALREPAATRLPPVAPETLAGVIRNWATMLDQSSTAAAESTRPAAPAMQAKPAHLGAIGPA
jgi:hypothetical protein